MVVVFYVVVVLYEVLVAKSGGFHNVQQDPGWRKRPEMTSEDGD